jgi:hypothetical protein
VRTLDITVYSRLIDEEYNLKMIPVVGVEPTLQKEHDFESCASANSATPANMEAATGFEPVVKVLQTSALPLGYAAIFYGAEDGIRTRDPNLGKVVFYH